MFCLAKYHHVAAGVEKSSFKQSGVRSCENVLCSSRLFFCSILPSPFSKPKPNARCTPGRKGIKLPLQAQSLLKVGY